MGVEGWVCLCGIHSLEGNFIGNAQDVLSWYEFEKQSFELTARGHWVYVLLCLQIPLGIQIATSIRIGQYLGSGSKLGAITATRLGIFIVCTYTWYTQNREVTLQGRYNGHVGVSNHQPCHCLLNRLFRADQRKHQSSASLAFVWGIHRRPVNSPHKWPVTRKMFAFDDVIMMWASWRLKLPATRRLNNLLRK